MFDDDESEVFQLKKKKKKKNLLFSIDLQFTVLWDGKTKNICGVLTVTDLIDVLYHYHEKPNVIKELIRKNTIRKWREIGTRKRPQKLLQLSPDQNLLNVINFFEKSGIRRAPVVSDGCILHILTHALILSFLMKKVKKKKIFFKNLFRYF